MKEVKRYKYSSYKISTTNVVLGVQHAKHNKPCCVLYRKVVKKSKS